MQRQLYSLPVLVLSLSLLPVIAGCPASAPSGNGEQGSNGGGGDHGHSHSHDAGPSGGHLIELGEEDYHVEWLHDDDEGRLTFIILDADAKEQVPIEAENLTVKLTMAAEGGAEETIEKEIPGVERDADGKTARFELVDKATIVNILKGGDDVQVMLDVPIGEEEYSAEIEHEDHGHSHSH